MIDLSLKQKNFTNLLRKELLELANSKPKYSENEINRAQRILWKSFSILNVSTKEAEKIVHENFDNQLTCEDYLDISHYLFQSKYYLEGACAIIILAKHRKYFKDEKVAELFLKRLEGFFDVIDNWSHCDSLCLKVFHYILEKHQKLWPNVTEEWIKSDNKWLQRAAMVSFTKMARKIDITETVSKLISKVITEDDHMIQKAIGWLLKETYSFNQEFTLKFIRNNASKFKKPTITLAPEKMPKELKNNFRYSLK